MNLQCQEDEPSLYAGLYKPRVSYQSRKRALTVAEGRESVPEAEHMHSRGP